MEIFAGFLFVVVVVLFIYAMKLRKKAKELEALHHG